MRFFVTTCLAVLIYVSCLATLRSEISFEPSWQLRTYNQTRDQILAWLETKELDAKLEFQSRSLWPAGNLRASDGTTLLERAVETFALVEPRAKTLVEACNRPYQGPSLPKIDWLDENTLPDILSNNLRLYYARWLAQHRLYDEVLSTLAELNPQAVVDPAGLLFYQMVASHQIVELDKSHAHLEQLMEHESQLPRRYLQVAQLLRRDLAGSKEESLDNVARRMNDVRRRLDIGRAGKQVQVVEKDVVDSLDRIIKKLEQQQQGGGASSGAKQSDSPMQDSKLPSAQAPMQVDQRDIGNRSGWGDLPEKEREQALQQIGREFPAHYREIIEQYFRELADESNTETPR